MRAVLLDFNGTLFNDTRFHMQAWRRFIAESLGLTLTDDEIRRRCIGPGNADIFRELFNSPLSPADIIELGERKEELYRAAVRANPQNKALKRGVPQFLDLMKARGVPCVLATASPLSNVRFYLDELGLDRWFTFDTIVYDDGSIPAKPDPAFYLEAARRAGVSPADCLIAEDSPTGIRAALASGAGRVVVLEGTAPGNVIAGFPGIFATAADFTSFERFL